MTKVTAFHIENKITPRYLKLIQLRELHPEEEKYPLGFSDILRP